MGDRCVSGGCVEGRLGGGVGWGCLGHIWGGGFTRGMPGGEVWTLGEEGMSMTSRGYSGWVGDKQGGVGVIY